ncbi:MAG: heavy-metal-associated domain-containing protein [Acidobacteria bacterium]|nr:heavy-metal-associated domain-containing protein [Acidobacteriota bacterium]
MNLSFECRGQAPEHGGSRTQLITLVVDTPRGRGDADPVRPVLGAIDGVEVAERDPATARVWVFANGSVEPESLVDALATWGYGAYVLDNRFEVPA